MPEASFDPASFDPAGLKAIVFDLDGTLYRQPPLRRAMLLRLLRAHALHPLRGLRTFRALSAYRRAQEHLRDSAKATDLAEAQLRYASEQTGLERTLVAGLVARWMEEEPLSLLGRFHWPGALEFIRACKARGLRLGVLSDYPAQAKLQALGLGGLFEVVLCAQEAEVGLFKPHPRGLQLALERLGASAQEGLYIGDRAEVDAAAAAAAGVPCAILTRHPGAKGLHGWMEVAEYRQLQAFVCRT